MKLQLLYFSISIVILTSCKSVNFSETEKPYLLNDPGNEKLYLVELIRENKMVGKLGETPMVIINREVIFYYYKEDSKKIDIKKSDIKDLKITEAKDCVSLYGAACKFGLIEINTYKSFP